MGWIDLHAHVLPGLDDGPRDTAEALALLRQAEEGGIDRVVASPHGFDGRYPNDAGRVHAAVAEVQAAAWAAGISVKILPGMEIYLNLDLVRQLKLGQALGIDAGPFVLVELPHRDVPLFTEEILFDLQVMGFRPIINHPERNRRIQESPGIFRRMTELGALGACTAGSLTGRFGPLAGETAGILLRQGLIQCLVSDGHRTDVRPTGFGSGPAELEALVGPERSRWILEEAPEVILAGRREELSIGGGRLPGPPPAEVPGEWQRQPKPGGGLRRILSHWR